MAATVQKLLIAICLTALMLPGGGFLVMPKAEISEDERRTLAPPPDHALLTRDTRRWTKQAEAYFDDRFFGRAALIGLWNRLSVKTLGNRNHPQVLIGEQDWLFQNGNPHLADITNRWPFSTAQLDNWAGVLSAKQQWLKEQGIGYLFVAPPNKHLVYGRYLPAFATPSSGSRSRLDQLVERLESTSVNFIDLRDALAPALRELRGYHKTDTHWNAWGAYIGYRAILQRLAKLGYNAPPVELMRKDFVTRPADGGDLAQLLAMKEELAEPRIEPATWQPTCARYPDLDEAPDDHYKHFNLFITTCDSGKYRVLMFRDSYALALMPYLSESFAEIRYEPYSPASLEALKVVVQEFRPDMVVELRASRWLRTPQG